MTPMNHQAMNVLNHQPNLGQMHRGAIISQASPKVITQNMPMMNVAPPNMPPPHSSLPPQGMQHAPPRPFMVSPDMHNKQWNDQMQMQRIHQQQGPILKTHISELTPQMPIVVQPPPPMQQQPSIAEVSVPVVASPIIPSAATQPPQQSQPMRVENTLVLEVLAVDVPAPQVSAPELNAPVSAQSLPAPPQQKTKQFSPVLVETPAAPVPVVAQIASSSPVSSKQSSPSPAAAATASKPASKETTPELVTTAIVPDEVTSPKQGEY